MYIGHKFESLVGNLRTTNHLTVSDRYHKITRRLNLAFWGLDSTTRNSRYVGSYGRGTAIKGFSDVDMLMVLPYDTYAKFNAYRSNGQSALLQQVKLAVKNTYPLTDVGGDGQVVVVNFSDGTRFEIVPAFLNKNETYTYPDSNDGGQWRICNPVAEIFAINEYNKKYNKKVEHLVRMMKAWKVRYDVPITGMLLETLAMQFMDNWEYNDKSYNWYDWMARDFFKYLSIQDREQVYWKAKGSGQYVWRTGAFEFKAQSAFNLAEKAAQDEDDSLWKQIFGAYYTG
ncbi:nucleotidyltransferase domain-containing protein [Paenibacillus sp. FSL R7-0204]|uniref:SMODS domain-containing nucleotidyltransferase n=1 Tax=Paenibacillus sp. FSL R7-0204 TaxID=2921675 RepID=UPI0030FC2B8E